jgi:hypothetical protein
MKPTFVILVLAVILVALGAFLIIGMSEHDKTDQLEQNQPTQAPSSSSAQ